MLYKGDQRPLEILENPEKEITPGKIPGTTWKLHTAPGNFKVLHRGYAIINE